MKSTSSFFSQLQELLVSVGSVELSGGKAEITEVTRCNGDAFLVTVRNKKRVGYTYELTLKVKGEWLVGAEKKVVKGHIEIPEFSFGELDDLQIEARLSEDKDLEPKDKQRIKQDFRLFLQPLREKLLQFEQELKERGVLSTPTSAVLSVASVLMSTGSPQEDCCEEALQLDCRLPDFASTWQASTASPASARKLCFPSFVADKLSIAPPPVT
nr:uncharacterized protein LOC109170196 isoform X1 [Ipomoea batatas]GMD91014.1 uncharacterized protein LOC109170196 isoform X1 [Ipomoea batatas]